MARASGPSLRGDSDESYPVSVTDGHIRHARPEDAEAVLAIYAPIVTDSVISFELDPPSLAEMRRRMLAHDGVLPWLVCATPDTMLGYAYAGPHRERWAYQWSVEVSAYVHADHRRRSVGARLYTALFDLLARQGYAHAYAGIAMPNDASLALHQAMGFQPVGTYRNVGYKAGAWHDVSWWQRTLRDWGDETPRAPIPLNKLPKV